MILLILALIPISVVCGGVVAPPKVTKCCEAESNIWYKYNRQLSLKGTCRNDSYHIPHDIQSFDYQLARECINSKQNQKLRNPAYFLATVTTLNNCYIDDSGCEKYIMVCVRNNTDDCTDYTPQPTTKKTYYPTKDPTLTPFNCKLNPILFTTQSSDSDDNSESFLNWQSSFPVRMGVSTDNDILPGQIKFFWKENTTLPNDVIPCDGSNINSTLYPDLKWVLNISPFNGELPNCTDRVIIKSDENNIPFGTIGGVDDLPQLDIEHDHDLAIDFDKQNCHFDNVQYTEISNAPTSQTFNQMQPYLAVNILIATDLSLDYSPYELGEIVIFVGIDITIPEHTGLISCDGSYVSVSVYPKLYNIIKDKYFYNTTHFGIPNCNGKALISTQNEDIIGNIQGHVNVANIPKHDHLNTTIPLESNSTCSAEIDIINSDTECIDVNNVMPVFPVLFVWNISTAEFRFFIPEINTSDSIVTYLEGIAFGSNLPLNHLRGSNNISCDSLPFDHQHQYELTCYDTTDYPTSLPTTAEPTDLPFPEPTPRPSTNEPSLSPTLTPTPDACTLNDTFEFVFVVDNSCGIDELECDIQLQYISELLTKLKTDNIHDNPKIAYVEYHEDGARLRIGLNNYTYQSNTRMYYNFIREHGHCGDGGNGQTDLFSGLILAMAEFKQNGNPFAVQKIITINNCKHTTQQFIQQQSIQQTCEYNYLFVIDESASVLQINYQKSILAVQQLIQTSINNVSNIAALAFASKNDFIYRFNQSQTDRNGILLQLELEKTDYAVGATRTLGAMQTAIQEYKKANFTENNILILITDGHPTTGHNPCDNSQLLNESRQLNIRVIIIGVTSNFKATAVQCLVSNVDDIIAIPTFDMTHVISIINGLLFGCDDTFNKFNNTNHDICTYIVDEMETNGIDGHVMNIPIPNNLAQNSIGVDLNEYLLCFAEYDTDRLCAEPMSMAQTVGFDRCIESICKPPTQSPTNDPTEYPTTIPTIDPTIEPTNDPTQDPTKDPTIDPTNNPTVNPTNDPTPTPTRSTCDDFTPGLFQNYEFAIIVDNSCGLNSDQCLHQLYEIGQLLLAIKDHQNTERIKVTYIEYDSKGAEIKIRFNDSIQNNVTEYYNYIINQGNCGGIGNGTTDLVDGIDKAIKEFEKSNGQRFIYRKIFAINNCENNIQNTDTEICTRLYNSLEFDFEIDETTSILPVDRVLINIPPFPLLPNINNSISNASDYLSCFIAARNGQPTGAICAGNNPYPFTLDKNCRDAICDETQRNDPNPKPTPDTTNPTESPSLEPTLEPTEIPTSIPTVDPTGFPTQIPTNEPTSEPTSDPTKTPTSDPTLEPTEYPTNIPTGDPTINPTIEPTIDEMTPQPTKDKMCLRHNSEWSEWNNWSECKMYRDANKTDHVKHIHYRTRKCKCIGDPQRKANIKDCDGSHIEIEECDTDCKTVWSPWCPWSVCIIQNDDCITNPNGNGICNGFQFRTRSCLKELPNNRKEDCKQNCTCESDQYGNSSKEIRECNIQNCLHIEFHNYNNNDNKDNTCILPPQWRVEINDHVIQQGGNIGDNCIPAYNNDNYTLIINRGCGIVKWHYKGKELGQFQYDPKSNKDYMYKPLPITITTNQ